MSQPAEILPQRQDSPAELPARLAQRSRIVPRQPFQPGRPADEEVLRLVQRVFLVSNGRTPPHSVVFCAVNSGAGCSWVCARAAEALAHQVTARVCIVEANFRWPSLYRQFEMQSSPGFLEFVKGAGPATAVAQRIRGGNLWVIPAGAARNEPDGTVSTERLQARFSLLQSEFDFVLLDTPAADCCADAFLLAQLTNGVILVLDSHTTRRETARDAKLNFEAVQVPVLGAVLNRRAYPIPAAIYKNI